ncbi:MAG TPA: hypothetical protein VFU47_17705 [Armatimonadota bacterium]|nr:hypothetical protein [Armatimonadota bacterium]
MAEGKIDSPVISDKNRTLLRYVQKLTLRQSEVRDADVQALRGAGWTDEQIFEASFTTALFAFFTRMADAYGLDYPRGGYLPPAERPRPEAPAPAGQ